MHGHQSIWQILYDAGADLVLNGHEHHYERFAEMNASGTTVSPGLREIVVGTAARLSTHSERPRVPARSATIPPMVC
jgi:hypothetical protein